MPCSSEHLEPTARERELKNVAELLVIASGLFSIGIDLRIVTQAKHVYGQGTFGVDHLTAQLCHICETNEGALGREAGKLNPEALRLAQWWVRHQKHDKSQEA